MIRRNLLRIAPACLAVFAAALMPAAAGAQSVPAHLRVLNTAGKVLADQTQYTGTVRVRTSPAATCFGAGTAGSGNPVTIQGPTALGIVQDASATARSLRPLRITDAFSFGLGVCGFGGFGARAPGFWYLKVDHKGAQVGGDQLRLGRGDDVLWYLSPAFPAPAELFLAAPSAVGPDQPFSVRVFSYDDTGQRTPVAGASVTGADLPTGSDGRTTVSIPRGTTLRARHGADIPSNAEVVCVDGPGEPCRGVERIAGSNRADRITGTAVPNVVRARGGNDHVNVRGGSGPDTVNCGSGRDTVVFDRPDRVRGCERTIRR